MSLWEKRWEFNGMGIDRFTRKYCSILILMCVCYLATCHLLVHTPLLQIRVMMAASLPQKPGMAGMPPQQQPHLPPSAASAQGQQPMAPQGALREISPVFLCRIGQETVQDIVTRTMEIFQITRATQVMDIGLKLEHSLSFKHLHLFCPLQFTQMSIKISYKFFTCSFCLQNVFVFWHLVS